MQRFTKKFMIPSLICSLLFCACGMPTDDENNANLGRNFKVVEPFESDVIEKPEKLASQTMQAVYVQYADYFLPVAFWKNGESLLNYENEPESGQRWRGYDELEPQIQQYEKELLNERFIIYKISADERIERQAADYQTLKGSKIEEADGPYNANHNIGRVVATSDGFAPNFASPIHYVEYTVANQQDVPDQYRHFVKDKLDAEGFYNTPIIIDEIWYVDLDGDGLDEAFVSSRNKVKCFSDSLDKSFHYNLYDNTPIETENPDQLAVQEGLGEYAYFFLYSETFPPIFFYEYPSSKNGYDKNTSNTAVRVAREQELHTNMLVTKQEASGVNEPYGILYFYAQNDQIAPFMVMTNSGRFMGQTITNMQKPIILDWDGDGDYDVCIALGGIYGLFEVYIQEDGKLEPQAGLHLPA